MARLHVLSAGAAKGLVTTLAPSFEQETGHTLASTFGAVGAMQERLDAGDACDVIILSRTMIDALDRAGRLRRSSIADIGRVPTGVAMPAGAVRPDVTDADALRQALLRSSAVHVPDTQRSTAGIHCLKIFAALGVADDIAGRLKTYPNGATAMAAMAGSGDPAAIGITQVTEILYTPGVTLVARLPHEFELATVYTVAALASTAEPEAAEALVRHLVAPASAVLRRDGGFEPV